MKRVALLVISFAACLGLAACSSSASKPKPTPSATPAAVQQTTPPPPAQPAAEANWEQNSAGYQSWLDVGSDMHQLGQDLNAGNMLAVTGNGGIGFEVFEASAAALQNPSPVDSHAYKVAMANFGFMGAALVNDNINAADTFTKKAFRHLQAWAAVAQPGATGTEGCGNWNLPQSSNC